MLTRDKLFIGGQWVAPSAKETIEVHNAGTGQVMGSVPAGTEKDIDAAVAAALGALESWSATPPAQRAEVAFRQLGVARQRRPRRARDRVRRWCASPGAPRVGRNGKPAARRSSAPCP